MSAFEVYIRYQKGKLNVIKREKISFLSLFVLLTGLWNLKGIQNLPHVVKETVLKKLVRENAVAQALGNCPYRLMGS